MKFQTKHNMDEHDQNIQCAYTHTPMLWQ